MSAYCSQNDLLGDIQMADLITLTDDDSPATGVLNSTVLNAVISKASGVIDRMVGNVYDIPFNPTPASINSLAIAIACYTLYRRIGSRILLHISNLKYILWLLYCIDFFDLSSICYGYAFEFSRNLTA